MNAIVRIKISEGKDKIRLVQLWISLRAIEKEIKRG